jgi:hypothetical protein
MNSVRYICGVCGTHFDIPVTYVNRKVRCKCGKVDVAVPSEVEEELSPPPQPQYAPPPQYAPSPGHGAYSTSSRRKQKSRSPLMIGDRNGIVIIANSLGSLFILIVGFFFIKFLTEIDYRILFKYSDGERIAKFISWVLGMLAGVFLYLAGQIQLLKRSRVGIVFLIIGFVVMTGLCFLAQEYIYLFFSLSWGKNKDIITGACLIFFLTIFPLFFVSEGLD